MEKSRKEAKSYCSRVVDWLNNKNKYKITNTKNIEKKTEQG